MGDRIVSLQIEGCNFVLFRKTEISENSGDKKDRKADKVLLCQDLVHASETWFLKLLKTLEQVDLS